MQIHDLNEKSLTDPAWVAFDDGTDTYKADFKGVIDDAVAEAFTSADVSGGEVVFDSSDEIPLGTWNYTDFDTIESDTLKTLMELLSKVALNVRWLYQQNSLISDSQTVCIRHKKGTVTLPDGTSSRQFVDISISDISVPTGFSLWQVGCTLGNYQMPYVNGSGKHTGVSEISNTNVRLFNDATAWNSFTYYLTLIYVKG